MKKFEVSTDSTCDLYADEIKRMGIFVSPLEYSVSKENEISVELDNFKSTKQYFDFYKKLREGAIVKTSILNLQSHIDLFTDMAKKGIKQALHITQSYGLSPTLDNAKQAIEIVKKEFSDIDYIAMESNTTTIGEGMVVRIATEFRNAGKTKEEAFEYLEKIKHNIQHFIIVNDLKYLTRGGRISQTSANIGSFLQIKPIIGLTKEGKLKIFRKVWGLKKALNSIANEFKEFSLNKDFPYVYILHTDNIPLANELKNLLLKKYGVNPEIRIMGPIVGAHVGPNAVAYGFISNKKRPY